MSEGLEKIMKEKISADHLLYVSMKYTKTCDVMINLIKRWKIMMDYAFDALLDKAKKKKIVKKIPSAPKLKLDSIKKIFQNNPAVLDAVEEVCLRISFRSKEIAINLEKLKEYSEILERFINYTKLFLSSK
jgi:hypothetical protein